MYKLALIPGDGIGPEVCEALLHILEVIDLEFDYTMVQAGDACYQETGNTIPDETIQTQHYLVLLQLYLDIKVP